MSDDDMQKTQKEFLVGLGFEIEPFGKNTISIQAVPADIKMHDPVKLIQEVVHDLATDEATKTPEEKRKKMIDMIACRSAVKFGDALTREEQIALIETLEKTPNNQSCTHGRPVSHTLTLDELAKIFKRVL